MVERAMIGVDADALQRFTTRFAEHPVRATIRPPIVTEDGIEDGGTEDGTAGETLTDSVCTFPGLDDDAEPAAPRRATAEEALAFGPLLGRGGMGVVHLAQQHCLGREVAVKRVRPDRDRGYGALTREGLVMGALEHPNIIPVHALLQDRGGRPVLVMKRVEGVPWDDLIADPDHPGWKPLQPSGDRTRYHVEILMEVCQAIHFAHSRGIVHRDLKPENVMVGRHGEVYVLDWGIATPLGQVPTPVALCGTPSYMAPEMLRLDVPASETLDVYLLGACLYDVLENHPPHTGRSMAEVLGSVSRASPLTFSEETPGVLAAICRRAMSAEPDQRYSDAAALRGALLGYIRHLGAVVLAGAATERLNEATAVWETPSQQRRVGELLAEARFGFAQALEVWPECPAAQDGERRCSRLIARACLDRGDLEGCAAALGRLAVAGVEDTEGIGEELERVRAETARVQALAQDLDLGVARRPRNILTSVMLAAALLFSLWVAMRTEQHGMVITPGDLIWFAVVCLGFLLVMVLVMRRWLVQNVVNRRITGLLMLCGVGMLCNRLIGLLIGAHVPQILLVDLLLLALLSGAGAITLAPWMAGIAVTYVVSIGVGIFWAGSESIWFGGAGLMATLVGVASWYLFGRPARGREVS